MKGSTSQSDINAGKVDNTATADSDESGPATDDETVNITKVPSLSIVKTGTLHMNIVPPDTQANVGDTITYTFNVTNTGNVPLTNVAVTDPKFTVSGGPISLAVGASDTTTFTGTYTLLQSDINAGKVDNTATADSDESGPATDDETVNITKVPSLSIVKTGTLHMNIVPPDTQANVGDTITYTFNVTNTGNVPLTNINVTDPMFTVSGGPITLAPGASDTTTFTGSYTLTQADIDAGKVDNTATASGKDPGNNDVTNTGSETVPITQEPSISVVKIGTLDMTVVAPTTRADAGDKINFTFVVTNTGNVTLSNVTVSDSPALTTGPIPASVASLAPGASTIFTGSYTLTQADINAGKVDDIATATGTPSGGTVSGTDTETVTIPRPPAKAVPGVALWGGVTLAVLFSIMLIWLIRRRLIREGGTR